MTNDSHSSESRTWWILAIVLASLCLMIRMQGLLALPIFGDEAIYLRWAQLVREGHPWVSLCDPKPPLHFWLIALFFGWMPDPLAGARVVSVLSGVLCVPAVMLTCGQLGHLLRPGFSGRAVGLIAAVLMIFCPFLSFYQRLATADALFVLESLVAAWLSLCWAQRLVDKENAWGTAAWLGVVMGVSMMTRQGLSYTLWGLPVAALFLQVARPRAAALTQADIDAMNVVNPGSFSSVFGLLSARALGQFAMAVVIAGAMWTPYLAANFADSAAETGGMVAELKRRILYQTQFTSSKTPMSEVALRNFNKTFVPSHKTEDGEESVRPTAGWMLLYLTPAVYMACVLGMFYLALRGEWLAFFFLLAWVVLMLGPPVVMGNVIFSRYVLAGVPPLLIAGACLLTDTLTWIVSRRAPAGVTWSIAGLVLVGVLVAPMREMGIQTKHWTKQNLTEQDHYQYIAGWTAGSPTRSAIQSLLRAAKDGPLVVITDAGWGTPSDAAWVYLSRNANVTLYWRNEGLDGPVILRAAGADPNVVLLRKDKFLFRKPEPVTLPAGVPVFLLTNDPAHTPAGEIRAEEYFRKANPNLGAPITFNGVDSEKGGDRVILLPVR